MAKKRVNVHHRYRYQWLKLHTKKIVEVYMNPKEHLQQHAKDYKAIIAEWPVTRIQQLPTLPGLSIHKLSGVLGITRRTLRKLMDGTYTPSATLCRRMEMIEADAKEGKNMATDLLPARSEMRRRLILFRSWWMNRDPSRDLPEITVAIRVTWGKGTVNTFELPVKTLPRLRIVSYAGLVDTVRAVTKALRSVAKGYGKLLWKQQEEDYWQAFSTNTVPAIVEERLKIPARIVRHRKTRPVKNA